MQLASLVRGVCLWTVVLSSSCTSEAKDPLDFGAATAKPKTAEAPKPAAATTKKVLKPTSAKSGIGTNLSELSEYATSQPFNDAFKHARAWLSTDGKAWEDGRVVDVDARGWVKSLLPNQKARALVVWGDKLEYPRGAWQVTWHGTGTLDFWPQGGVVTSTGEGKTTLNVDPGKGGIAVTITKTDAKDPIRDIQVLVPGAADAGASTFHPAFVEKLKGYGTLRFMDWMKTNHATIVKPEDRPQLDDSRWLDKGLPIEAAIELCNVAGTDCWINIGHTWNNDLVGAVARVAKAKLDPQRRLYVEHSNEVWNGIFPQHEWVKKRAIAAEISQDSFEGLMRWHARRTVEIGHIFDEAFGADSGRVVVVLGAWAANAWSAGVMLDEAKKGGIDAVAIAPYFGNALGEPQQQAAVQAMDVPALLKALDASVDETMTWVAEHKKVADKHGVWLVSYEGGQHLMGVGASAEDVKINALFDDVNRHPGIKPVYARYLAAWKASGGGLFMHFNDVMASTKYGRWGALETQSQSRAQAPKYDALMTFSETVPRWF